MEKQCANCFDTFTTRQPRREFCDTCYPAMRAKRPRSGRRGPFTCRVCQAQFTLRYDGRAEEDLCRKHWHEARQAARAGHALPESGVV